MIGTLLQDLRYSIRMLSKSQGFTAVAVLTLALGIGANTAIFSVVNSTLLSRPSYSEPDRLVMVWEVNRPRARDRNVISPGNFLHWQSENSVFEQMAAFYDYDENLTGEGDPERLPAQGVTPNMMSLLGVRPLLGRAFLAEDGAVGKNNSVILSYSLWERRFGSDPGLIGKSVVLDGKPQTVVGVMPQNFQLFIGHGSLTGQPPDIWTPIAFTAKTWTPVGRYMTALARLKPGVSVVQAQSQMDAIAVELEKQFPDTDTGWGIRVVPLHEQFVDSFRPALLILLGAVGLVLLIACANVANLQLAHATARRRELAVRSALGASPSRIARQLLTESIVLAVCGGAAGILLANWAMDLILGVAPRNLFQLEPIHLDLRVLLFAFVVSVATGILFGLAPAFEAFHADVTVSLKQGNRIAGQRGPGKSLRRFSVITETALALVLLVGAGLLIRSLDRLQGVSPGFDPHNLLTMKIDLPDSKYHEDAQTLAFFHQLLERVRALPGVQSASANAFLPFTGLGSATSFTIVGRPEPALGQKPSLDVRVIEPDYFRTMRIPLLRGRFFNERESAEESHVVIISDAMARESFPNQDPIGQQVIIDMKDTNVPSTIVGVVGDIRHVGLDTAPSAMCYWPHPELVYSFMTLAIRSTGDPASLAGEVQQQVRALDKDLPVSAVRTMDQWMGDSLAQARFNTMLLAAFAGVALLLAAVGIYGVMAYSVTQRTREIGIRMALGAQIGDVLRLITREGFSPVLRGVALGMALAFAAARLLHSLVFQISVFDPWTFAAVAGLLTGVALVACYLPARRAARVDPLVSLRHE